MPQPPTIVLWIVCLWWIFKAGYWLIATVVKIRDAMEAEEARIRQSKN